MTAIEVAALLVGRTYRVEFSDCCVQGEFTSALVSIERDEDGDAEALVFAHGRVESLESSAYTFSAANKEDLPISASSAVEGQVVLEPRLSDRALGDIRRIDLAALGIIR